MIKTARNKAVIFDIDGTLADHSHRQHYAQSKPRNWKAYNELMHLDKPAAKIVNLIEIFKPSHRIILCSGRSSEFRNVTTKWLSEHNIFWEDLHMRPEGDFRSDHIIKEEILNEIWTSGYNPEYAIDDRNSVVAMWRRNGLTCLQCQDGDF